MLPTKDYFIELRRLGASIRVDLPDAVDGAASSGWSVQQIQPIKDDVRRYFRLASRVAFRLGAIALLPTLVAIVAILAGKQWLWVYVVCGSCVGVITLLAAYALNHLLFIIPSLRKLPDAIYRDLIGPLWINLDVLNVAVSISLSLYIFRNFSVSPSLPILLLIAALWLFAPWTAYLLKQDLLFACVRVGQFIILTAAALFTVASPVPMEHFEQAALRATADRLRPVERRDVTANWATLEWFTQEGAPNVWYSWSADRGYRLFSAPGHDPDTNEELKSVNDGATRDKIISEFVSKRDAAAQKLALQKEKDSEDAQLRDKEKLGRDFISARARVRSPTERIAALIIVGQKTSDTGFADRLSEAFNNNGLHNSTSIFRPSFADSAVLQDILAGKAAAKPPFSVQGFASHLLVLQIKNTSRPQQAVNGVDMTAIDSVCTITLLSATDFETLYSSSATVHGVGFNEDDATKSALDRLEKAVAQDAQKLVSKMNQAN